MSQEVRALLVGDQFEYLIVITWQGLEYKRDDNEPGGWVKTNSMDETNAVILAELRFCL